MAKDSEDKKRMADALEAENAARAAADAKRDEAREAAKAEGKFTDLGKQAPPKKRAPRKGPGTNDLEGKEGIVGLDVEGATGGFPAGYERGEDAPLRPTRDFGDLYSIVSNEPPVTQSPRRTNRSVGAESSLPTSVARKLPGKGMVEEDGQTIYRGSGLSPHIDLKTTSDEATAQFHLNNYLTAKSRGDMAAMAQHKEKLHAHIRKAGDALLTEVPSVCNTPGCGGLVHHMEQDAQNVGAVTAARLENLYERERGKLPEDVAKHGSDVDVARCSTCLGL